MATQQTFYGGQQKGGKQWQEDAYFFDTAANDSVVIAGVFDGHGGLSGQVASNVARDTCQAFFKKHGTACQEWTEQVWTTRLCEIFKLMHDTIRARFMAEEKSGRYVDEGVVREASGEPVHGGSTGSVTVMIRRKDDSCTLITANTGDSTGILLPREGNKWEFTTVDHGPENQDEWRRINSLPAKEYPKKLLFVYDQTRVFRKYECPLVFKPDGTKDQTYVANPWGNGLHPTNVRYEPAVYAVTPKSVSKDSTCIAMTRALGDFYAFQFGLSHVPDVTFKTLPKDEAFTVCLASDGIWDCWKYEDFHLYVNDQITKASSPDSKSKNKVELKPVESGVYQGVEISDWAGMEHLPNVGQVCLNESVHRAISNFGIKHYDDATLMFFAKPKYNGKRPKPNGKIGPEGSANDGDDDDLDDLPPIPQLTRADTTLDMGKMVDVDDADETKT